MQRSPIPARGLADEGGEPPTPAEVGEPTGQPRGKWALLILGIGLILLSLNLRIGVASIGPVLGKIRVSLSLSATSASLLTMAVLAVGILLRLHPSLLALIAGTVLVGASVGYAHDHSEGGVGR